MPPAAPDLSVNINGESIMLRNLKKRGIAIWSNPSGKSASALLFLATIIGQTVQFLGMLILTRLYSPSEFGIFAVFLALNTWFLPLCCLRYEWAIPLAENEDRARHTHALALILAVINGILLSIIIYIFTNYVHKYELLSEIRSYMLCLSLIFIGVFEANRLWFVRQSAFSILIRLRLVTLIAPVTCQILLGGVFGGIQSLLFGYILGQGLNTACSLAYSRSLFRNTIKNIRIKHIILSAKTYRKFALFTCPAALVSGATLQMPSIVLPVIFNTVISGSFALGQRVILSPVYLINYSVRTVFWADAGKAIRDNPETLRGRFFKTSIFLSMLFIPAILFAPYGPQIFSICFGEEWREAGVYASVLIIPAVTFVVSRSTSCLDICGHNKLQMFIDCGQFILTGAFFALAWWLSLTPLTVVYCLAGSAILAHVILWTSNALILARGFKANLATVPA